MKVLFFIFYLVKSCESYVWKQKLFYMFLIYTYALEEDKFSLIKYSEGTFLIVGNLSSATYNIRTAIRH